MIVYGVVTKVLGTELFAQHNIADLNSDIAFIVLLSEEKPLAWKKTHTHTHTHTHARTFKVNVANYTNILYKYNR